MEIFHIPRRKRHCNLTCYKHSSLLMAGWLAGWFSLTHFTRINRFSQTQQCLFTNAPISCHNNFLSLRETNSHPTADPGYIITPSRSFNPDKPYLKKNVYTQKPQHQPQNATLTSALPTNYRCRKTSIRCGSGQVHLGLPPLQRINMTRLSHNTSNTINHHIAYLTRVSTEQDTWYVENAFI